MGRVESPKKSLLLAALLTVVLCALAVSGIRPYDRPTWLMEVAPVLIALPLLIATRRRFELTTLAYVLVAIHAVVLIVGGAYTYARVPLGYDLQNWLGLARNPYDRIGHFAQGFVPAILAREILLRASPLRPGGWLSFLVVCVALAISACYELIEWAAALALGQGAAEFLGTQGDPWDTQSDMAMALVGAVAALLLLSHWHDRQLAALAAGQRDCASGAASGDRGEAETRPSVK
jgi:putative membrane protein